MRRLLVGVLLLMSPLILSAQAHTEGEVDQAPPSEAEAEYKPHQFEPAQRDLAWQAYQAKDYIQAILHMENHLSADPGDKNVLYDLACTYALIGEAQKALANWEKAVDAGWLDGGHASEDPDLDSIRMDPRFQAALERCEAASESAKKAGPKDFQRHYLPMTSLWTYIVALPPNYEESGEEYPVCLILHGSGSTETGHGSLADTLGREGVIYVCPRAPYPHGDVFAQMKKPGYTAWPPDKLEEESPEALKMVPQYVDWIFACVDDAREHYRIDGKKVFIIGHSQGAGLANACALLQPRRVESYFAYAGFLHDQLKKREYLEELKVRNVRPYLAHCREDAVVPVKTTIEVANMMKDAGVDYRIELIDGGVHSFTLEVNQFAKQWLDQEVRQAN